MIFIIYESYFISDFHIGIYLNRKSPHWEDFPIFLKDWLWKNTHKQRLVEKEWIWTTDLGFATVL